MTGNRTCTSLKELRAGERRDDERRRSIYFITSLAVITQGKAGRVRAIAETGEKRRGGAVRPDAF